MNHQLTTMLCDDTVSRREERLRLTASLAEVGHSADGGRENSRGRVLSASTARRWVGHAMARGGHTLSQTGERIARDRRATLVTHG